MHAAGDEVRQSDDAAAFWYARGAELGDATSMYNLGFLYFRGKGVSQDYVLAMTWYRQAAGKGSAVAMNALGFMYAQGRGVDRDIERGYAWFTTAYRVAADKEVAQVAEQNRAALAGLLDAQAIARAERLSNAFVAK